MIGATIISLLTLMIRQKLKKDDISTYFASQPNALELLIQAIKYL